MNRFQSKTVVVTGAASGIGAATAQRLYEEGACVVAVDRSLEDIDVPLEALTDRSRVQAVAADVTDRAQVANVISTASERFGQLHGLVNSAGIRGVGNILDVEPAELERVLSVNLLGTLFTSQAFARVVTADGTGGAIVNVSSAAGIRGVPNRLPYVASKYGVVGITQAMALDLAPLGVRVNSIAPGLTRTPMTKYAFEDPAAAEAVRASHPIGRAGEPHEMAAAIAFLLSDDASFITGAILPVDGGHTVGVPSFGGRG